MTAPTNTFNAQANAQINKPVLKRGSTGAAVQELQRLLNRWETYFGDIDGIFDIVVENGVRAYQHRVFLKEDGIVGNVTWQALYSGAPVNMPVLKKGSTGEIVVMLQRLLQTTGDFNSETSPNLARAQMQR
jgi:peptidoglycan hydrolase-like protein with peptidoglycan-binding domain